MLRRRAVLLAAVVALVASTGSTASPTGATVWSWDGTDSHGGSASLDLGRTGSGPVVPTAEGTAYCASTNGYLTVTLAAGIPVRSDGTFAYSGSAEVNADNGI